jgi:hypothetical protein
VTPQRLADPCRALLRFGDGPVLVEGPNAAAWREALAAGGTAVVTTGPARAAVIVLLAERGEPAARAQWLASVAHRLSPGAPVVLVDHNQPRAPWRRVPAGLALVARGLPPRRARYPAARELAAAGFTIDCLRLAAGERIQLVRAHRTP